MENNDWQKNIPVEYDQNRGVTLKLHDPQIRKQLGRALLDDKSNTFAIGTAQKQVTFDCGGSGSVSSGGRSETPSAGFNASSR